MKPEHLAAWKTELTNDPAGLGYAGKTHEQIDALLESSARDVDANAVTPSELFDQFDADEYLGLTTDKRAILTDVMRMPQINPASVTVRKVLAHVFGAASKTGNRLKKLTRKGRRWEELGLPKPTVSDVANALR